ncbi:hypothetical protein NPIL_405951 [Nephila pilipes]|uniref:Uncharacterized protein n=1 Tax=Nephila pilipes TaxID=299642 RepID=A0A8X6NZG3_NEPPI|nr:hypothetical protein NPIL_405951 [Nephila pilipes]
MHQWLEYISFLSSQGRVHCGGGQTLRHFPGGSRGQSRDRHSLVCSSQTPQIRWTDGADGTESGGLEIKTKSGEYSMVQARTVEPASPICMIGKVHKRNSY